MPCTITGTGNLTVTTPVKIKSIHGGMLGRLTVQVDIDGSEYFLMEGDELLVTGNINLVTSFQNPMTVRDALKVIQKELSSD